MKNRGGLVSLKRPHVRSQRKLECVFCMKDLKVAGQEWGLEDVALPSHKLSKKDIEFHGN